MYIQLYISNVIIHSFSQCILFTLSVRSNRFRCPTNRFSTFSNATCLSCATYVQHGLSGLLPAMQRMFITAISEGTIWQGASCCKKKLYYTKYVRVIASDPAVHVFNKALPKNKVSNSSIYFIKCYIMLKRLESYILVFWHKQSSVSNVISSFHLEIGCIDCEDYRTSNHLFSLQLRIWRLWT